MKIKLAAALLGLASLTLPAIAPASQPEVTLAELTPNIQLTRAQSMLGFMLDPIEAVEFSIEMPEGIEDFDIDRDPFASGAI